MEGTIAQILMFAGTFAPKSWAFCNGQIMAIAQNTALFSILGTMYGGDGRTTFALPDFRGRIPIGAGQGPGLPDYQIGEMGGMQTTTLTSAQLPTHMHTMNAKVAASTGNATGDEANANVYASTATDNYASPATGNNVLGGVKATPLAFAGSNQPFDIHSPYLAMNFVICLYGVFPVRN